AVALAGAAAQPGDMLETDLARFRPRLDLRAPKGKADPGFWAVVKHGRDAVPALLAMLDDARPVEPYAEVPDLGGVFARGDVALEALLEIVDVPWQELVPRSVKKRVNALGFGACYEYVRTVPDGRKQLAGAIRRWCSGRSSSDARIPALRCAGSSPRSSRSRPSDRRS